MKRLALILLALLTSGCACQIAAGDSWLWSPEDCARVFASAEAAAEEVE